MPKFVIVALFLVFAAVNARGITGQSSVIKNNELTTLDRESRVLLEVPLLALGFKALKLVWFLLSTICSVAALALAVNVGFYLLSNFHAVIIGAGLVLGFCKLTGLCGLGLLLAKEDPLAYAEEHLQFGASKYDDDVAQ